MYDTIAKVIEHIIAEVSIDGGGSKKIIKKISTNDQVLKCMKAKCYITGKGYRGNFSHKIIIFKSVIGKSYIGVINKINIIILPSVFTSK